MGGSLLLERQTKHVSGSLRTARLGGWGEKAKVSPLGRSDLLTTSFQEAPRICASLETGAVSLRGCLGASLSSAFFLIHLNLVVILHLLTPILLNSLFLGAGRGRSCGSVGDTAGDEYSKRTL